MRRLNHFKNRREFIKMPVFRVERTKGFTVMSNYHLQDTNLSLKAKGLLSMMLSFSDKWNYTIRGLAAICKEGVEAISTGLKELEKIGYLIRRKLRNESGRIIDTEYTIYERPIDGSGDPDNTPDKPHSSAQYDTDEQNFSEHDESEQDMYTPDSDIPETPLPHTENPDVVTPHTENNAQINTNRINTERTTTDKSIPSIHFPSEESADFEMTAKPPEMKREVTSKSDINAYRNLIRDNIRYIELLIEKPWDEDRLDQIVELMTEVVCSNRSTIRVAGSEFPQEVVKSRFLKLDEEHIRFVFECLDHNHTKIRNMKQYLITTLFNAYTTKTQYYYSAAMYDNDVLYGHKASA